MANITEDILNHFPKSDNRTHKEQIEFLKSSQSQVALHEVMVRGFMTLDKLDVEDPLWDTLYDVLAPVWDALDEEHKP